MIPTLYRGMLDNKLKYYFYFVSDHKETLPKQRQYPQKPAIILKHFRIYRPCIVIII